MSFLLASSTHTAMAAVPAWLIIPFGLLLLLIAAMSLTPPRVKHFWEHYYPHIAIGMGVAVAGYFVFGLHAGGVVVHTLHEYFSFICLIGSLYIVAGGIHIRVKGEATPTQNAIFLFVGAVVANHIGTTGASMVMIRPWIRTNKIRISAYHIVFFIFVVSNCGGALTPIGDPPLFIGFLRGVPFFWLMEHVLLQWLCTILAIIGVFWLIDRHHYAKVPRRVQEQIEEHDSWRFDGGINAFFLLVIVGAVFLSEVPVVGPLSDRFLLREWLMIGAAVASYRMTNKTVHAENQFTFGPIKEVAFLFAGIFMTMMPALGYINQHGGELRVNQPMQYYLTSGSLSAVLDNAPTYATFLQLAETVAQAESPEAFPEGADERAEVRVLLHHPRYSQFVVAISLGAVFFGAMTYIGNGPNFMVKAIAEAAGVRTPTFVGYIVRYSLPILLPILLASGWLFLR
ncbi:MAG: sodium:proton antiporter [Opitutaceae bacterium]|nr:sodium:proton antiporter [Opitutaceae bacterium]